MENTPIFIKTNVSLVCVYETVLPGKEFNAAFKHSGEWKDILIKEFPELSKYKCVLDIEKDLYWLRFYETQVSFQV